MSASQTQLSSKPLQPAGRVPCSRGQSEAPPSWLVGKCLGSPRRFPRAPPCRHGFHPYPTLAIDHRAYAYLPAPERANRFLHGGDLHRQSKATLKLVKPRSLASASLSLSVFPPLTLSWSPGRGDPGGGRDAIAYVCLYGTRGKRNRRC